MWAGNSLVGEGLSSRGGGREGLSFAAQADGIENKGRDDVGVHVGSGPAGERQGGCIEKNNWKQLIASILVGSVTDLKIGESQDKM